MQRVNFFGACAALWLSAGPVANGQEPGVSGWCCNDGDLVAMNRRQCEAGGRQHFSNYAQARAACPGLDKTREGWCCVEGVVFEAADNDCWLQSGVFSVQLDGAERVCVEGAAATVITVTTTADNATACGGDDQGPCSLREAIHQANQQPGPKVIRFKLRVVDPGYDASRGAWVLQLTSPLPVLQTHRATIDGGSMKSPRAPALPHAPRGCSRPAVELAGGAMSVGLLIQGNHNLVRGLAVYDFGGPGIRLEGDGNVVTCNYLGTDITQSAGKGNGNGIAIRGAGHNNSIGVVGGGNLISGNLTNGVFVAPGCTNTSVEANLIGLAGDGLTRLPNGNGITLDEGSHHARIGGTGTRSPGHCDGSCNVISGNNGHGVHIAGSDNNVVVANFVGVSADGANALGNGLDGVSMLGSRFNRIGGGLFGLGNVISGNRDGVVIQGVSGRKPSNNTIEGNFIGTDARAVSPVPNQGVGIRISVDAENNVVGGSPNQGNVIGGNQRAAVRIDKGARLNHITNNRIGINHDGHMLSNGQGVALYEGATLNWIGGPLGKGNIIAYNNGDAVHVEGPQTLDNGIASNSIFANLGKGISLVHGGNGAQPALRIWQTNLIDAARNEYYIVGQLAGITPASPDYRVAIYSDATDEGRWTENPLVIVEKAQKNLRFGWFGAKAVLRGNRFTYTVSDHLGHNTSEFHIGHLKPSGQGKLPFDMDYWQLDPDNHIPLNPHYHGGWGIYPRTKDIRKLSKPWSWDQGMFIKCAEDQVSPGVADHYRGWLCGYFLTYHQTVMFTGDLYWESYVDDGTPGFEDTDNNFGLWAPGMAGVHLNSQRYLNLDEPDIHKRLECPGGSVCDARDWTDEISADFHIADWVEQTRFYPLLTLEIDRGETFDNWAKHPFWGALINDGAHLTKMLDGKKSKVIGRWAMDGYHYCRSEVHPVFGMAVQDTATTSSGAGKETWHFFMRRKGDQAVCGGTAHAGRRDWYFRFDGREGVTPTAKVSNLLSNNWSRGVTVAATGPHAGGDVLLKMQLPDTDDRVCGTITIEWQ